MKLREMNNMELNQLTSWRGYPDEQLKKDFLTSLDKINYQVFVYRTKVKGNPYFKLHVVKQGTYKPLREIDMDLIRGKVDMFEMYDYACKTERSAFIKYLLNLIKQIEKGLEK